MVFDQIRGRQEGAEERSRSSQLRVPASLTDRGCVREVNEDRFLTLESPVGSAYFVFDGMGGERGGEAAAQLAFEIVRTAFQESTADDDAEAILRGALSRAHQTILLRRSNPALSSMGTTVVGIVVRGREVIVASVGDSRAYLMHDQAAQQLTSDHTFVQQLVDEGHIQPQDALLHPQSHILTRCLGSSVACDIDVRRFWVWPKTSDDPAESLLLCSDGLYSLVSEGEMACVVAQELPTVACAKLVQLARERGGFDNITTIVVPLSGQLKSEPFDREPGLITGAFRWASGERSSATPRHRTGRGGLGNLMVLACKVVGVAIASAITTVAGLAVIDFVSR